MSEKTPQNNVIEWWRNITSLIVSISATAVLANYWIRDDKSMLYAGANLAFLHCTVDLAFTSSPEIWFHHFIVISFRIFQWIYDVDLTKTDFLMVELVRSELSTFFLAMRHILKYVNQTNHKTTLTKTLESWNETAFVISFIWIRLWLYVNNAILDPELYRLSNFNITVQQPFAIVWIYGTVFTFLSLNLYWFSLILKTLFKKLIPNWATIQHAIRSELILEYTFYFNIFIAFQNYHQRILNHANPNEFWNGLVDMIGIINLAANSHEYHYQAGEYLKCQQSEQSITNFLETVSSRETRLITSYINDSLAIQIRCLFVVMAWTDFSSHSSIFMFVLSTIMHSVGFYNFYHHFLSHYMNHRHSIIAFDDIDVLLPHLLPVFFDNILMILHPDLEIWQKNGLFMIMVLFACMKKCKPFYHYSHVGTHVLLWIQTYILSYHR